MGEFCYEEAVAYISKLPKFTKKHDHEHTRTFLFYLGNPQNDMKIIHVAGTNGKGSVCVYLSAMLQGMGKQVGTFVSPHLVKINERILLEGREVSDSFFLESFQVTYSSVNRMKADGFPHPSYFEFLLGMGMVAFHKAHMEYVVLETGLGGRLDATNAVQNPVLCMITSISRDHTQYLGNTLEEIAKEKAGIIKPGIPVVCQCTDSRVEKILTQVARQRGADCKKIGDFAFEIRKINRNSIAFSPSARYYGDMVLALNSPAKYQAINAMLALEGMRILFPKQKDWLIWKQAIESVKWEGRMEEILPGIVIDGAHNPGAIRSFVESVQLQPETKMILLFSAVMDKDYETMISYLCSKLEFQAVIVTTLEEERGVSEVDLSYIFAAHTEAPIYRTKSVNEALKMGIKLKGEKGILYGVGSLYLVGEIKRVIQKEHIC